MIVLGRVASAELLVKLTVVVEVESILISSTERVRLGALVTNRLSGSIGLSFVIAKFRNVMLSS